MVSEIKEYLKRRYEVVLQPIEDHRGQLWLASIPDLPGCMSDGTTPAEAVDNIEDAKRAWIETALELGRKIPAPRAEELDEHSGKFTVRLPRSLHRKLAWQARVEGVSLNQLVLYLLSAGASKRTVRVRSQSVSTSPR